MQRRFNHRWFPEQKAKTLFEGPLAVIGHLSEHHPFPAALSESYVESLKATKLGTLIPEGTALFEEGDEPTGVYVILEGRARLAVNSAQGKTLVLGFFGTGTILGLAAAILGRPHATTAETLKPTKILFVSRKELVREMRVDATAACRAAEIVSEVCYFLLSKMRAVELSQSAEQKLARCLLGLLSHNRGCEEGPVQLDLSHESLAQLIGVSRETVSRILSRLRSERILHCERSALSVRDRSRLERIANWKGDSEDSGTSAGYRSPASVTHLKTGQACARDIDSERSLYRLPRSRTMS